MDELIQDKQTLTKFDEDETLQSLNPKLHQLP